METFKRASEPMRPAWDAVSPPFILPGVGSMRPFALAVVCHCFLLSLTTLGQLADPAAGRPATGLRADTPDRAEGAWPGQESTLSPWQPELPQSRSGTHSWRALSPTSGTFRRSTQGYLGDSAGLTVFPVNGPRLTTVLSCSSPNDAEIPDDEDGGFPVTPWCCNAAGLYAASTFPNARRVLYSADGRTNWSTIHMFDGDIVAMHATSTGRLLAWVRVASEQPSTVWHSEDNGQTWTKCVEIDASGVPIGEMNNYTFGPWTWSFHEAAHGTIIAGTYPYPTGFNQLWRSVDDGVSWQKVYELEPYVINHFHAICYHGATGIWVADTGDGSWRWLTKISLDDGLTWTDWRGGSISPTGQVTRFRDIGDPTRLVVGSDAHLRAGWFDLTTWRVGTYAKRQFETKNSYFFDLFQFGGLWYGVHPDSDQPGKHSAMISVSPDLVNWVPYWRCSDPTVHKLNGFVGFVGGRLHFMFSRDGGSRGHLCMSPATVTRMTGLALSPRKLNLLPPATSMCDTLSGWVAFNAGPPSVIEIDSSVRFHPAASGSIRVRKYGMQALELTGVKLATPLPTVVGRIYKVHAWVKGVARGVRVYFPSSWPYDVPTRADYGLLDNGWTEVWSGPLKATSTNQHIAAIAGICDEADRSVDLWIGAAEVVELPLTGEWSPGGVVNSGDVLDYAVDLPSSFTHVFSVIQLPSTSELTNWLADKLYLRSYLVGRDYVELYFDAADRTFKLSASAAGPGGSGEISTVPRVLQRGAHIKVAVRYRDGVVHLSVADGVPPEHVAAGLQYGGTPLPGPQRVIRTGDHTGDRVLPCVLFDDCIYDGWLENAEIDAIMRRSGTTAAQGFSNVPLP